MSLVKELWVATDSLGASLSAAVQRLPNRGQVLTVANCTVVISTAGELLLCDNCSRAQVNTAGTPGGRFPPLLRTPTRPRDIRSCADRYFVFDLPPNVCASLGYNKGRMTYIPAVALFTCRTVGGACLAVLTYQWANPTPMVCVQEDAAGRQTSFVIHNMGFGPVFVHSATANGRSTTCGPLAVAGRSSTKLTTGSVSADATHVHLTYSLSLDEPLQFLSKRTVRVPVNRH